MERLQITINNEKIDFTLEKETNLFEVLESLRGWLESEGFVMTSARTDERDLDHLTEEDLKKMPLGPVGTLRIGAQSAIEREYRDLSAIDEFFRVLKAALSAGQPDTVKQLMQEYHHLQGGLDGVLERNSIAADDITAATLDAIVGESGLAESGVLEDERRERLFAFVEALRTAVGSRMREIEDPGRELAVAADDLRRSIEQLSDVSIMLQTGRDQEAMEAIVRFAELSGKIIRLYPLLRRVGGLDFNSVVVEGVSFPEFYADFNTILGELIDAFTAEDSVLIGDLLEYEIAPRLEKLRTYIDLLTGS